MKKQFRKLTAGISAVSLIFAFSITASRTVRADDFSYDPFLTQVLEPSYGFSPVGTSVNPSVDWDNANWDSRAGIITISQQDLNADDVNDCLVYRIAPGDFAGNTPGSEGFWLDLYSHDTSGTIHLIGSVLVAVDEDVNFHRIRTGLMQKQDKLLIYVEDVNNAYLANGHDYNITWYGYDGLALRPYFQVGKSRGGSDGISYSLFKYTDSQNYEETILKADPSAVPAGTEILFPNGSVMDAVCGGFKLIGLPDPSLESYENSDLRFDPDSPDTFPTYFNSQSMNKVFEYNANGSRTDSAHVSLSVTLTDYTGLNTNPLSQSSPLAPSGETAAGGAGGASGTDSTGGASGTGGVGGSVEGKQEASVASAQPAQRDYLIPDSASRALTSADIENMTAQQLKYARNEIYARHGRIFSSSELQQYFSSRSWYRPTVSATEFNESVLNEFEWQNISLLTTREQALTGTTEGYKLDQPGYDINAVWNNR